MCSPLIMDGNEIILELPSKKWRPTNAESPEKIFTSAGIAVKTSSPGAGLDERSDSVRQGKR
jgi:hypothetical protein